jgi:preprotein translocase subunit SecG
LENVVLIVHLILALCLIGVVLLQRSEGAGILSGGGNAMAGRPPLSGLAKLTWGFGIAFCITSITLTVFAARNAAGTSVVEQFGGTPPAAEAPASDESPLGDDLLPPVPADAPAAPPAPAEPATTP